MTPGYTLRLQFSLFKCGIEENLNLDKYFNKMQINYQLPTAEVSPAPHNLSDNDTWQVLSNGDLF